jgi:hypothetical protein
MTLTLPGRPRDRDSFLFPVKTRTFPRFQCVQVGFLNHGYLGGKNGRNVKPKIHRPEGIRRATLRSLVAWLTWHPGLLKNGSNTKTALLLSKKKWQGLCF